MGTLFKLPLLLLAAVHVVALPKSHAGHQTQLKTLYFLTILPYPDPTATVQPAWDAGPHLLPAAELAVELINNRTGLLEGYHLELISDDGGCNIAVKTVTSFVRQVIGQTRKQPVVGIIGGGCSDSTLTISPLCAREEVSLINMHLGGSPLLKNRELYPNTFGASGSSHAVVSTIFSLMKLNNWQQISVLYEETMVVWSSIFLELVDNINVTVPGARIAASLAVGNNAAESSLTEIKESLTRIIVVATSPELARRIMCLAYHEQMLFPAFQWILVLRTLSQFTTVDTDFSVGRIRYMCSGELMSSVVLRGNLMIRIRLSAFDPSSTTAAGISYDEYLSMYEERIDQYNSEESNPYRNLSLSIWAPVVFDEVWALAVALNNSNLDLSNYQSGKEEITSVIRKEVYKLDFDGISGHIKFDNATGFSTRGVNVFQVFAAQEKIVTYHSDGNIVQCRVNCSNAEFISDQFKISVAAVSSPMVALFATVTLTLLFLITTVHIVTLKHCNHRVMKASSPLLNQLIYVGCYLSIVGTLMYYFSQAISLSEEIDSIMCHAVWVWIIPIGYILIIGTIIARTWRLYRLFTHTFNPGRLISNPVLFMFVFVLLCVYVMIGAAWTAIDPLKIETVSKTIVADKVKVKIVERTVCRGSRYFYIWTGIISTYSAVILLTMVVLSLMTMKIDRKNFTTKALRVMAYMMAFIFLLCVPVHGIMVVYDMNIYIPYVALSFFLNSVIFLCFALVFLPPILALMRGRSRFIRMLHDHFDNS